MNDEHVVDVADLLRGQRIAEPRPRAAVERATPPNQTTIVSSDEPLATDRLIAQLQARLKVVEREIKNRKALETERAQIKRLLTAAKAKPASVRNIRDAG